MLLAPCQTSVLGRWVVAEAPLLLIAAPLCFVLELVVLLAFTSRSLSDDEQILLSIAWMAFLCPMVLVPLSSCFVFLFGINCEADDASSEDALAEADVSSHRSARSELRIDTLMDTATIKKLKIELLKGCTSHLHLT